MQSGVVDNGKSKKASQRELESPGGGNRKRAKNSPQFYRPGSPKTAASDRIVNLPLFVMEKLRGKTGRIVTLTPIALESRFRRTINRLGLPHFRFHDLRHYNVSVLHAMGIPDKYIMAQGGWATNYTMNNVYNHTFKDKQAKFGEEISARFEEVFEKNSHENSHEK